MFTMNPVHTPGHVAWAYLLMALFCVFGTSAATAQAVHEKEVFVDPFDATIGPDFTPCLQEDVHITGTLRTIVQLTFVGAAVHVKVGQATDLIGVGLESGDTYQVSGPFSFVFHTPDDVTARVDHVHNVFLHIVGSGGDSKALLLETFHLTTNANGEVTVEHPFEFEARCPTT